MVDLEIPEDVMKAAHEAYEKSGSWAHNSLDLIEAIALAILAERERCASVAEDSAPYTENDIQNATAAEILANLCDVTRSRAVRAVAAAIRQGDEDK